jgi:hypothetical protein
MKQELKDIAVQTAVATPTAGWAILTSLSLAEWIAITLGVLQGLYLLRKWWREETEWGIRLKRWAGKQTTKPGDLEP